MMTPMDLGPIAKACGVDAAWFEGWDGETIGIYPVLPAAKRDSGAYRRVAGQHGPGATWVLDNGVRSKQLTALEAARARYALDRLGVRHFGRAPMRRQA
jgi:hypothetical protein